MKIFNIIIVICVVVVFFLILAGCRDNIEISTDYVRARIQAHPDAPSAGTGWYTASGIIRVEFRGERVTIIYRGGERTFTTGINNVILLRY